MTAAHIAMNGSKTVTYLIHGLELTLEFSFQQAWLVLVGFNPPSPIPGYKRPFWFWQRLFWFGKSGTLKQTINKHYPYITLTVFSPLPKTHRIPLHIDAAQFQQVVLPQTTGNNLRCRIEEEPIALQTQDLQVAKLAANIHINSSTRAVDPIALQLTLPETKSI